MSNNGNTGNSIPTGQFATLDIAFIQSPQMREFQRKIGYTTLPDTNDINNKIKKLLEDSKDGTFDETVDNIYVKSKSIHLPEQSKCSSIKKHQPGLVENIYQKDLENLWNNAKLVSYYTIGMNLVKFIMLIVLLCILAYCLYWIYEHDTSGNK
jgi:hypothetical protein